MKVYKSQFAPSPLALKVMKSGRVIAADETPELMVERITDALFEQELKFSPTAEAKEFAEAFGRALDDKEIVMSTPVMTRTHRAGTKPPRDRPVSWPGLNHVGAVVEPQSCPA